jgi:hypothetical protein
LAELNYIHVFPLTKNLLTPYSTSAEIVDAVPHCFTFLSTNRRVPDTFISSVVGGGTAFLIRKPCPLLSSPFESSEMLTITLKLPHSKPYSIRHLSSSPPSSPARDAASFSQFLEDFKNTHLIYIYNTF